MPNILCTLSLAEPRAHSDTEAKAFGPPAARIGQAASLYITHRTPRQNTSRSSQLWGESTNRNPHRAWSHAAPSAPAL
eukprot:1158955-Pelagomonas_calceolata.AAC.11